MESNGMESINMKPLQHIENLQTQYSNFETRYFPTKCRASPPISNSTRPPTAQDYQNAMQFVQTATNRITRMESEEIIPSVIDFVLCRRYDSTPVGTHNTISTSTSNISTHNTNNTMQGVDVALACRMLHGQNAKYLLHLETILMQYGYISPSQREEEEEDNTNNDTNDDTDHHDNRDTETWQESPWNLESNHCDTSTRRNSILLNSFHNHPQDMEDDSLLVQGGFRSSMLDDIGLVGEPLKRLSEEEEEYNEMRNQSLTPQRQQGDDDAHDDDHDDAHDSSESENVNPHETLQDVIFKDASCSSSSCSVIDESLQLDDSMGDDTAELLVSFEDVSTVEDEEEHALEQEDDNDDSMETKEEDDEDEEESLEDEEESLDPTIVCNRKILETQVLKVENVMESNDDDDDENGPKLTSPLDKYQVQILNGGTICRVSPIANDVLKGTTNIQSPILKTCHVLQPSSSTTMNKNDNVQMKTPTKWNVSLQDCKTIGSKASISMNDDDDDDHDSVHHDLSHSFHYSEDEKDVPLLSESGLTFRKLNQTRCIESSLESSLDEDIHDDISIADDDNDSEESSSDNETLIRVRTRSSDSSFEPSTNGDDDDDDNDDDESDVSETSTRVQSVSSKSSHISENRKRVSSFEEGHDDAHAQLNSATHVSSTHDIRVFSSTPKDEIDDASVGTFESCISQQGQDMCNADDLIGDTRNVKEIGCSTPVNENVVMEHKTPYNSSQKAHVRTPLAAAWIEKYMPDQKEKLLGQLSTEKVRPIQSPSMTKITDSVTTINFETSFASQQSSNDINTCAIDILTEKEYDEAPRVIKMQVSLSELNHTIQIINKWLSSQKGAIQGMSLQEETAYEILKDYFEKNKSKSLLMSLVHFRRLVMQLSSLAGGGGKRFVILQK